MAWRRPGDKPLCEPMMVSLSTHICVTRPQGVNTLRSRQKCPQFADDIFKYISLNDNFWILSEISLNYAPQSVTDNMAALVPIMAWHRIEYKILCEAMIVLFTDAFMCHSVPMKHITIMAWSDKLHLCPSKNDITYVTSYPIGWGAMISKSRYVNAGNRVRYPSGPETRIFRARRTNTTAINGL